MVMYDGRVAWSDLDSRTGAVLAEYVLLQEAQSVRSAASHVLRNLGELSGFMYISLCL